MINTHIGVTSLQRIRNPCQQMSPPWKCSRPCWMGLWAQWSSGKYPCPWQGIRTRWSL